MNLVESSKLFIKKNSSTILTCLGATGVVITSVMAAKATPKAILLLEEEKENKGSELTKLEVVMTAAPAYIPAVAIGLSTIACIFGANILNKRQQAALMSAYALINRSYRDYRSKLRELLGEETDEQVRKEMIKDKYEKSSVNLDKEKQLFFDFFSLRYFESTLENVQEAENALNEILAAGAFVSLNDFYDLLGLQRIDCGYELGWSSMDYSEVGFGHEFVEMEDGLECCVVTFPCEPTICFPL